MPSESVQPVSAFDDIMIGMPGVSCPADIYSKLDSASTFIFDVSIRC